MKAADPVEATVEGSASAVVSVAHQRQQIVTAPVARAEPVGATVAAVHEPPEGAAWYIDEPPDVP